MLNLKVNDPLKRTYLVNFVYKVTLMSFILKKEYDMINWRANTRSGLTHSAGKKLEEWVNRLILLDRANSLVIQTELTDSIVLTHGLALVNELQCTIGRTSRATFRIPAKRLNITIYPILGESLL